MSKLPLGLPCWAVCDHTGREPNVQLLQGPAAHLGTRKMTTEWSDRHFGQNSFITRPGKRPLQQGGHGDIVGLQVSSVPSDSVSIILRTS